MDSLFQPRSPVGLPPGAGVRLVERVVRELNEMSHSVLTASEYPRSIMPGGRDRTLSRSPSSSYHGTTQKVCLTASSCHLLSDRHNLLLINDQAIGVPRMSPRFCKLGVDRFNLCAPVLRSAYLLCESAPIGPGR